MGLIAARFIAMSHGMRIETERTPNPQVLKFLPGFPIAADGQDFALPEEGQDVPLVKDLFALGDVERVFVGRDFISVAKAEGSADWVVLKPQILGVLLDHLQAGVMVLDDRAAEVEVFDSPEDAEVIAKIRELLDTRIRPAVANDGGDIIYRGFQDGVVFLNMQGSCAGCPSATATLKGGIENLLTYYVPEVTEVRAV